MTSNLLQRPDQIQDTRVRDRSVLLHVRLGERLVKAGLITRADLENALRQQSRGQKLGESLVKLGILDERELLPFLAEQVDVPHVLLRDGLIDPLAARLIPRPLAEASEAIALFKVRDVLTVAMADPLDLDSIDRIERATGLRVRAVLTLRHMLEELLPRVYGEGFQVESLTADLQRDAVALGDEVMRLDLESMSLSGDSSPIINLVNYMVLQAVRQRASDIHIEPGPQHSIVRFRVDGILREILRPRREFHPAIVSRLKVMAKMDIAEHRLPQDGRVHVVVEQRQIDLRVSTLPTVLGEKAVLPALHSNWESLGFQAICWTTCKAWSNVPTVCSWSRDRLVAARRPRCIRSSNC